VKKAAQAFVKGPEVKEGLLNMVEMAFRAYDPCLACATHALPGEMPLTVDIRDKHGNLIRSVQRP
jgi:F420-non-reducing hydrogenase large subunit